jgi:hypothetical protein
VKIVARQSTALGERRCRCCLPALAEFTRLPMHGAWPTRNLSGRRRRATEKLGPEGAGSGLGLEAPLLLLEAALPLDLLVEPLPLDLHPLRELRALGRVEHGRDPVLHVLEDQGAAVDVVAVEAAQVLRSVLDDQPDIPALVGLQGGLAGGEPAPQELGVEFLGLGNRGGLSGSGRTKAQHGHPPNHAPKKENEKKRQYDSPAGHHPLRLRCDIHQFRYRIVGRGR